MTFARPPIEQFRHRRQGGAVEADLIALRRSIAAALLRANVDENRAGNLQGGSEDVLQAADVVAGNNAQVGDPQVLEQLAGLGEVDDHAPDSTRQAQGGPAHDRQRLDDAVVGGLALLPCAGELESREVLAEGADRRADRHGVVVEDDQQLGLAVADVVESLQREAAYQRRIADHHGDALHGVAQVAGRREALGDGQPGARVPTVENVVLGFRTPREAAQAAELANRAERVVAPGQQLVGVGLMPRVPDDPVARRLQNPMQGDGQLDRAERRTKMPTGLRDRGDDVGAYLRGQRSDLGVAEASQVARPLERGQDRQLMTPGRPPSFRPSYGALT